MIRHRPKPPSVVRIFSGGIRRSTYLHAFLMCFVQASADHVTLLFGGDTLINKNLLKQGFDLMVPWEGVKDVLHSGDALLLNHEGSVTDDVDVYNNTESILSEPTDVAMSYLQSKVRPDFVALANNHQHDHGPTTYQSTKSFFARNGIVHAGIGRTEEEAAQPGWLNIGGHAVAVLATVLGPAAWDDPLTLGQACDPVQCVPPAYGMSGVNFMNMSSSTARTLKRRAQQARKDGAWAVVLFFHWGCNWDWMDGTSGETWIERQKLAHSLIDDGNVDLIWGSSAHHIQPIELYKGVPIVYALGNVMVPIPPGVTPPQVYRTELAWLLKATFSASRPADATSVSKLELIPIRSNDWNVTALRNTEQDKVDKQWLLSTYARISRSFGSTVRVQDDGSWVVEPHTSAVARVFVV